MVQKFYFKSIGVNLKIAVYLFFKRFVKNAKKMTFLEISRKIKKVSIIKLSPIDLK
jgi:hypothetical protein